MSDVPGRPEVLLVKRKAEFTLVDIYTTPATILCKILSSFRAMRFYYVLQAFFRLSLCHLFWLACVTGLIFSRFSGEQRQARSERGAPARHLRRRKALLARFARFPSLVRKREKITPVMQANSDRLTSQVHN